MSAGYYHECDQCHKLEAAVKGECVAEAYRPEGWFTVTRHRHPSEEMRTYAHTSENGRIDVCSFACLVAYGQQHGWDEVILQGTRTPTGGVVWDTKELKMTMEPVCRGVR